MNKNKVLVLVGVVFFFIVTVAVILLNKNNNSLLSKVKLAEDYKIILGNCDNTLHEIDKNNLSSIEEKMKGISDNGPWLGDNNACYQKVSINYENNNVIQKIEIEIIDNSSIVITENNASEYYTNASELINYIDTLNA